MLHMEPAKSNGPWLDFIQNHTSIDRLGSADTLVYGLPEVDEYYTLTEALVTALFTDRQAIIKKVLSREVVEDAYFPCIDDPVLVDMIKQYNETTANFKMHYVEYLLPTVDDLFGLTGKEWAEAGKFNYFSRPEEVKAVMPRLTHYILYLTYGNMIKNDPLLSPLVIQANPNNVLLEPERLWAGGADGYTGYNLSDYCLLSNKIVQSLNN